MIVILELSWWVVEQYNLIDRNGLRNRFNGGKLDSIRRLVLSIVQQLDSKLNNTARASIFLLVQISLYSKIFYCWMKRCTVRLIVVPLVLNEQLVKQYNLPVLTYTHKEYSSRTPNNTQKFLHLETTLTPPFWVKQSRQQWCNLVVTS